jgi:hypothetical protein
MEAHHSSEESEKTKMEKSDYMALSAGINIPYSLE